MLPLPQPFRLAIPFLMLLLPQCRETATTSSQYRAHVEKEAVVYGPYSVVKLPIRQGVQISNPIQIAIGPGDQVFATNQTGEIYRLLDTDGDGLEDMTMLYAHVGDDGLHSPAGFTHRGDTVYIGAREQIRAYLDRDRDGKADTSWTFFNQIPQSAHPYEWTSGLTWGPDGFLYVALTTDSWNAAPSPDPLGYRGAILRIAPDGRTAERIATGIRSVPDMLFTPQGELLFLDNGGGGNPTEELNLLIPGSYYGHNKKKYAPDTVRTNPMFDLTREVAPSALAWNPATNDFGGTGGHLFVSYYGPGERWTRGAISHVRMDRQPDGTYACTESLVADLPKLSALTFGPDGSLYAAHHGKADYWYNSVFDRQGWFYRIFHDPEVVPLTTDREKPEMDFSENSVEQGKQLYAELSCLGCHQVDGSAELLGPNLTDIGQRMSREEIREAIVDPSKIITPSMMGIRIETVDGRSLLGRVVSASEDAITLMVIGNQLVTVARDEIRMQEETRTSLMYPGLLTGLAEDKVNALLDYLQSLGR